MLSTPQIISLGVARLQDDATHPSLDKEFSPSPRPEGGSNQRPLDYWSDALWARLCLQSWWKSSDSAFIYLIYYLIKHLISKLIVTAVSQCEGKVEQSYKNATQRVMQVISWGDLANLYLWQNPTWIWLFDSFKCIQNSLRSLGMIWTCQIVKFALDFAIKTNSPRRPNRNPLYNSLVAS